MAWRTQLVVATGSSPHARGTLLQLGNLGGHGRFIPAYAGNASARRYKWPEWPVHPRMRGERISTARGSNSAPGSSPHARGTRRPRVHGQHRRRFIPACAGNAPPARRRACPPTVHPRMRGERMAQADDGIKLDGSSPHARGTPNRQRHRIHRRAVHPRMRGERLGGYEMTKADVGSSPHARGTRQRI